MAEETPNNVRMEDGDNTDQTDSAQDALSSLTVEETNQEDNADGNTADNENDTSANPPPQAQPFSFQFNQPPAAPGNDDDDDDDDDEGHADLDLVDQNEFLSLLPKSLLPKLDKLKSLHNAREEIMKEYLLERAKLEARFGAMMKPLYEERRKIVVGEMDEVFQKEMEEEEKRKKTPSGETDEGGENNENVDVEEGVVEEEGEREKEDEEFVKGIPQFWACAMGHFDVISELVTEDDVDCLEFMTDVTCDDFPDGTGFELKFHFSPENPYFTNTVLTKRYEVPNLLTEDEPILKNVTGTTINWKKNKSLTHKEVTKKQRKKGGRGAGQIRTVTKRERTDSFFHFFSPPKMPKMEDVLDEEEADAVEEAFDFDYDVAQAFRGHLIPKGVLWFTGEAADGLDDEDLLEGMEGVEEEDGEGESPFPPPVPGNGENQECKQN